MQPGKSESTEFGDPATEGASRLSKSHNRFRLSPFELQFSARLQFHRALRMPNHQPSPISTKLTINQTSRA